MPNNKRHAPAPAAAETHRESKKHKAVARGATMQSLASAYAKQASNKSSTSRSFDATVPATPEKIVDLSATLANGNRKSKSKSSSCGNGTNDDDNGRTIVDGYGGGEDDGTKTSYETKNGKKKGGAKGKNSQRMRHQQPTPLPLEPHAAILAELQPRFNVLTLSVISSTNMGKRISAVLNHLGASPAPGVVLLHARAHDVSKMTSVAEIVKRRIREGFFASGGSDSAPGRVETTSGTTTKKTKTHTADAPQSNGRQFEKTAWYQYNRLYDVQIDTRQDRKRKGADQEGGANDDDDDEDGAFEPMPQQFQDASIAHQATSKTTTFMSIIVSRVPLPALERQPDITTQTSSDPVEAEYQEWMATMT